MSVTTTRHIRKPLYVDAVRVTERNFEEIAEWCQGEIRHDEVTGKQYIRIRVHKPWNPRQTQAFVGDWLLYTEKGYKVYTHKAFLASFDDASTALQMPVSYPYDGGGVTVLGPEIFVQPDGSTLCWKGINYVRQDAVESLREAETQPESSSSSNGASGAAQGSEQVA
jgi:hypothetical protein